MWKVKQAVKKNLPTVGTRRMEVVWKSSQPIDFYINTSILSSFSSSRKVQSKTTLEKRTEHKTLIEIKTTHTHKVGNL